MDKILVTGASGFIGSSLVDRFLEEGYNVFAGIREKSSREYLQDSRINFIDLPYNHPKQLYDILKEENFSTIFHLAGITKAQKYSDFETVNFSNTKTLVDSIKGLDTKLIFFSSFAACGEGENINFSPKKICDPNTPNTGYGRSKLMAEEYIRENIQDYIILRPTGVYGPRETDYLVYFKTINNHLEPYLGYVPQRLTFVYIDDLLDLCLLAMKSEIRGKTYFVSDGNLYLDKDFAKITKEVLGKWTIKLKFPLFIVSWISCFMEFLGKILNRTFTLNKDKYNILKARNWNCDIKDLRLDLGYKPKIELRRGVEKSIAWYKAENKL